MAAEKVRPLQMRIRAAEAWGYFIDVKYVHLGWWAEEMCFTLWGARRKARRMRARIERDYIEQV